jgi:hypothetical protein
MTTKKSAVPLHERTFDATGAAVYDADGSFVAGVMPPTEQDVARRLVACWNTCRGIPTEDIERGKVVIHRVKVNVGVNHGKIQIGQN